MKDTGVFVIEYDCIKCGSETTKVFITKSDLELSPWVLNKMCTQCLNDMPLDMWVTAGKDVKKIRAKKATK